MRRGAKGRSWPRETCKVDGGQWPVILALIPQEDPPEVLPEVGYPPRPGRPPRPGARRGASETPAPTPGTLGLWVTLQGMLGEGDTEVGGLGEAEDTPHSGPPL